MDDLALMFFDSTTEQFEVFTEPVVRALLVFSREAGVFSNIRIKDG